MTKRGTADRGYDYAHKQERKRWQPIVDRGEARCHAVVCLKPTRDIEPGEAWHLGHTPDRATWTGPEHEHCNTSEGATRGNRMRRDTPTPTTRATHRPRSRQW